MKPEISISIINTNNRELVLQCLESVYATAGEMALEVILVNNACTDGSAEAIGEQFPQVKMITNQEMLGFSTNNNLAFAQASGRYLMLLNDDTIVQPGAFQAMLAFMDAHPEAAAVGASLYNPDGSWQICYGRDPNPFYEGLRPFSEALYPVKPVQGEAVEVAELCGACMMVRSAAAEKVGYLDTQFDPLYSEEVDWCYRFRQAGWKVYHLPEARVVHLGGVTMKRASMRRYERIYEKKALFFRKHFGRGTQMAYKVTLMIANLAKSLFWFIQYLLRPRKRADIADEMRAHWNLARRALFL